MSDLTEQQAIEAVEASLTDQYFTKVVPAEDRAEAAEAQLDAVAWEAATAIEDAGAWRARTEAAEASLAEVRAVYGITRDLCDRVIAERDNLVFKVGRAEASLQSEMDQHVLTQESQNAWIARCDAAEASLEGLQHQVEAGERAAASLTAERDALRELTAALEAAGQGTAIAERDALKAQLANAIHEHGPAPGYAIRIRTQEEWAVLWNEREAAVALVMNAHAAFMSAKGAEDRDQFEAVEQFMAEARAFLAALGTGQPTEMHAVSVQRERYPACVEAWPECESGAYDPRCCRFPKSCSCDVIA